MKDTFSLLVAPNKNYIFLRWLFLFIQTPWSENIFALQNIDFKFERGYFEKDNYRTPMLHCYIFLFFETRNQEMETTKNMSEFFSNDLSNDSLPNLRVVRELSDPEIWMDSKVV